MLGALPPEPLSLYNRTVAGRASAASSFEVDITNASRLWLVVQEGGSNIPEVIKPVWAQAEFVGPAGVTPLASVTPMDGSGLRTGSGPIAVTGAPAATAATAVTGGTAGSGSAAGGIRVKNPSVVVYDVAGKGFTRFRGIIGLENPQSEIGSTLNPQIRFFVFNAEPNVERLVPPAPGPPLPAPSPVTDAGQAIDRVFWHALGRPPSPQGLADLLWAVTMKPEFQLIY
jgi:hypothetical protein